MNPDDLETTAVATSLPGGQHVGVMPRLVRVRHIPTGIAAECSYHRSQMKNRDTAISMIEWGLAEMGWKPVDSAEKR